MTNVIEDDFELQIAVQEEPFANQWFEEPESFDRTQEAIFLGHKVSR